MNIENTGDQRPCVEYVADLYVRPPTGSAPVLRGSVVVRREIPARVAERLLAAQQTQLTN